MALDKASTKLNVIEFFLLTSMFFPWVSFRLNEMDTQPWAIFFCFLYLVLRRILIYNYVFMLMLVCVFFAYIGIAFNVNTGAGLMRSFAGLLMLPLMGYSFWLLLHDGRPIYKCVIAFNCIWLLVGILQLLLDKDIFSFLVSVRTSPERGVTGLAPEPTFYAIYLFFISWLLLALDNYNPRKYTKLLVVLNVLAIIFLAKSSMGFLFVVIVFSCVLFHFLIKKPVFGVFFSIVMVFLLCLIVDVITSEDSRISRLLIEFMDAPQNILVSDPSVNERASHVFFSIKGFFVNYGIPQGVESFADYWQEEIDNGDGFFWYGSAEKIGSGVGSLLYECGWPGLIILMIFARMLVQKNNTLISIVLIFLFFAVFSTAIPIAFPLVSMLLAVSLYNGKKHKLEVCNA